MSDLERENELLRRWLGQRLQYESGARRRLYLRPDGVTDKRHFGTPEEAINAALAAAEKYLRTCDSHATHYHHNVTNRRPKMAVKRYFPIRNHANPCPGCSAKAGKETMVTGVLQCSGCKGLVGECYRGEALALVNLDSPMQANAAPENLRYFDFTFIGEPKTRVHGWFDRLTQNVVQWG